VSLITAKVKCPPVESGRVVKEAIKAVAFDGGGKDRKYPFGRAGSKDIRMLPASEKA